MMRKRREYCLVYVCTCEIYRNWRVAYSTEYFTPCVLFTFYARLLSPKKRKKPKNVGEGVKRSRVAKYYERRRKVLRFLSIYVSDMHVFFSVRVGLSFYSSVLFLTAIKIPIITIAAINVCNKSIAAMQTCFERE